jgi:Major royal jelly protein
VKAEAIDVVIDGVPWRQPGGGIPRVHADGIALSPDNATLYFHALTGRTLYRVPTAALRDPALTLEEFENKVEQVGVTGPADGMECAPDGTLYLTSLEDHAVKRLKDDGTAEIVAQDPCLQWPDSLAVAPDGTIYVTTSRIHLGKGPYSVFRFKPGVFMPTIPQFYETTVTNYDPRTHLALHFITVPERSWFIPHSSRDIFIRIVTDVMPELGINPHCTIPDDLLAHAITAVLTIEGPNDTRVNDLDTLVQTFPQVFAFSQEIITAEVVPFEASFSLKSIIDIIKLKRGALIGAALGFYAGDGNSLLLVILVPTGMVICGAAMGLGDALQDGLRKRILDNLTRPLSTG